MRFEVLVTKTDTPVETQDHLQNAYQSFQSSSKGYFHALVSMLVN